jgi:hypothetical protein
MRFEPQLKKIKCLLKSKERLQKNFDIRRLMSLPRSKKTTPLSGDFSLVTQSLSNIHAFAVVTTS